ncbi:hypothetical protein [Bifidobacterium oedipodis]|uniref:Uncharacterized protein n=1 Tax=Bifidobacterium oedipodis TaxID=2675322 RepID=A0A7Y0HU37_9BIFI|nr:hypothetical protein [Bifidobacterium sp. DSM 109957]NMM94339.1 hypothetical protein [Bifidobacterium sp. DSM 109957]
MVHKKKSVWLGLIVFVTTGALISGISMPASAMERSFHINDSLQVINQLSSTPTITDEQLDKLLHRLENIPIDLQMADPRTTPNYLERLNTAMGGLNPNEVQLYFNPAGCAYEVGMLVLQYGIPVGKVINWIKKARKIYGGVTKIWEAIRRGDFLIQMGGEAQSIFAMILGIDGVIQQCFS